MPPDTTPRPPHVPGLSCKAGSAAGYLLRPLTILRAYRWGYLRPDIFAGITVAAVAIPQAIAYASIAELPPHYGLYTAAIGAIVGSLWGCSRFLATGPVNASSLLVLPILLAVAVPGTPAYLLAASTLAIMAGIFRIVPALLRFGAVVTLASRSVLIGFTAGAAVHIALGQTKHLLGLDVAAMPQLYRTVSALVERSGEANLPSLLLGLGTLAAVVGLKRLGPRFPAALIAIVAATLAVWVLSLDARGVWLVGEIPRSLPPPTWVTTGSLPDMDLIQSLVMGSMAVTALGLIEAVAASQALSRRAGDRLDFNQEFFGQGLANIAAGLFSGYPCSGSFTRSALAQQSGARTHLTGVFTGLTVLGGILLLAPWAGRIPRSAIAGVLLVVAWGMVDWEGIGRVRRTSRSETAIMGITFGTTLVLPLDFAVLAGVTFSLAFFIIRSSLPRVVPVVPDSTFRHLVNDPSRPACPQLGVLNIRGPLFFGAVYHIEDELRHNHERHPGQNQLMLRMNGVDICDLTGIEMLEATVKEHRQMGGDVWLVRPRKPVLKVMEQSGFLEHTLGRDHVLPQEGAIEKLFDGVLDPAICIYECEHRVFAECRGVVKHTYEPSLSPATRRPHTEERFVSQESFQKLADEADTVMIDIREPEEYRSGHIPGASSTPLRMLAESWKELPQDRTILLVCRSGRRSSRALHMLEDVGLTKIFALQGGVLAWRARGFPLTAEGEPVMEAADRRTPLRLPTVESDRRKSVVAVMRRRTLAEDLDRSMVRLSRIEDLPTLGSALGHELDRWAATRSGTDAVVRLDPSRPVLVVSCQNARRMMFRRLLLATDLEGRSTNLERIVHGGLQLLILGDVLPSENGREWRAIRVEHRVGFPDVEGEPGPTPRLDRQMTGALGLATMILALQNETPEVTVLGGQLDRRPGPDEEGGSRTIDFTTRPSKSEIIRSWTEARLGSAVAENYASFENGLPLLAFYDGGDDGLRFVASRSEPSEACTLDEIESRRLELFSRLSGGAGDGHHASTLLRSVFGEQGSVARYLVSHEVRGEGLTERLGSNLMLIGKRRRLVAALVRPGEKKLEVHVVPEH